MPNLSKAKSKGARRRAGRPKVADVVREPNGRAQRSSARMAEQARATVIDARMRLLGLSKKDAEDPLGGYAIGRMALAGDLGRDYQPAIAAVQNYVEAVAAFMRLKHPQMPMPKAMDYLGGRGASLGDDPSPEAIERIENRYYRFTDRLGRVDGISRMAFHRAAFHDDNSAPNTREAVKTCVAVLLGA